MSGGARRKVVAVSIVALIALGLVVGSIVSTLNAENAARRQAETVLIDNAHQQARSLSGLMEEQFHVLETISAAIEQIGSDDDAAIVSLFDAVGSQDCIGMLVYTGEDGVIRVGSNADIDISASSSNQEAFAGGRGMAFVSESAGGRPGVALSVPCRKDGRVVGVVSGVYYSDNLVNELSNEIYSGQGSSYVIDSTGQIVVPSASDSFSRIGSNFLTYLSSGDVSLNPGGLDYAGFENALATNQETTLRFTDAGLERMAGFSPIEDPGLPETDWFFVNEVDESAYASDAAAMRGTSLQSILAAGVFILAALLLFILYNRDYRRRQREDIEKIRARDKQYAIVLEQGSKSVYQYDIATGFGHHLTTSNVFDEGADRENAKAYMLDGGRVAPESQEDFQSFFKQIEAGVSPLTARFRLRGSNDDDEWVWYQEDATVVFDENGDPDYAIISYYDISEQIEAEERYERSLAYRTLAGRNTLASFHLDITEGRVDDAVSNDSRLRDLMGLDACEDFLDQVECWLKDDAIRSEYRARFSQEALLAAFDEGRTEITYDHLSLSDPAHPVWLRQTVDMFFNPRTGHVEGFLYARDIDKEHRLGQLLRTVVDADYDYILLVNSAEKTYRTFLSKAGAVIAVKDAGQYDDAMIENDLRAIVHPDDWKSLRKSIKLPAVMNRLQEQGPFELHCRIIEENEIHFKNTRSSIWRGANIISLSPVSM